MSETREFLELFRSFIDLQRFQLRQGEEIMTALGNLQASVDQLQHTADLAVSILQEGEGQGVPSSAVQSVADQVASINGQLAAALPTSSATATASAPATSSATAPASSSSTATASSSASASAPASSSSTATAPSSPARPAARRRPAAPPAADDGVFRG